MQKQQKIRTYSTWAIDKIPDITVIEELEFYNEILERIIRDPKFYLDNIDDLEVYRFSFLDYHNNRKKCSNLYK